MKLLRWKYVLPRLLLAVVVVLALRLGLDPLLRWTIVASGEAAVGAKVELAEVATSLVDGEIVLRGFAVASPQSPLKNLVQADESRLKVDLNALLHNRLVVRDGTISGIQFDTDRTTSGELSKTPTEPGGESSFLGPWLASANQFGESWLAQLEGRLNANLVDQLESPRLANELQQRWPEQYNEIRGKVESLRKQSKELEQGIREVRANPLRNSEGLGALQRQLVSAQQELRTLQQQLQLLPQQIEADRRAVLAARDHDEQFVRQQLQVAQLDGEGITQTLLGEATSQGIASALEWISWARNRMPAKATKSTVARGRGTNVFYGQAKPKCLFERIRLDGRAQLSGQPISLVGALTNATTDPHLLAEPMRLALRSKGGDALAIDVTIDRRGEIAKDHLVFLCPQLPLPGRTLGDAEKLALKLTPAVATLNMELSITGDQLSGEIAFHQPAATWSLDSTSAKNKQLAFVLGGALANVRQIEANVALAGTLQKPEVSLRSDLGSQLAAGLNAGVKQLLEEKSQALLASTREKVDAQLDQLAKAREGAQQELLAKLSEHQDLLGQLAALTGGGQGLSIPKLGQSLRLDTLRK